MNEGVSLRRKVLGVPRGEPQTVLPCGSRLERVRQLPSVLPTQLSSQICHRTVDREQMKAIEKR
jgi:hypothetical protein